MREKKTDLIIIVCVLEIVAIGVLFVPKAFPFLILPDEFGYWYNAAKILELPWRSVASLGSYYSYGYSAALLPLLALPVSGLFAYRIALMINLAFMIIAAFILRHDIGKESVLILLFPPLVIYSLSTMCEAFVFLLLVLTLHGLKKFLDDMSFFTGAVFLLPAFLLYITHNRCLPVFILAILFAAEKLSDKKRLATGIFLALLFSILFVCSFFAKNYFTSDITMTEIYSSTGFMAMIPRIGNLFSLEGAVRFIVSFAGNVFYIVVSTLGIGILGVKRLIRLNREKDDLSYFFLLSISLEMLISSLFLFSADSFTSVLYGRYIDPFCGLLLVLGAKELTEEAGNLKWSLYGLLAALIGLVLVILRGQGYLDHDGILSIGAEYLSFALKNVSVLLAAELVLSLAVVILLLWIQKRSGMEKSFWALAVILLLFTFTTLGTTWSGAISFVRSESDAAGIIANNKDAEVYYINEDGSEVVQILQFYLKNREVFVIDKEEISLLPKDSIVVTMISSNLAETLSDEYEPVCTTNCFKVWVPK
ncbi:MAG: hypothetical protein E7308_11640 [Butyrivibrio sp.]|nr:hypothetical protein [Butyrivibrio sp.]